MSDGARCGVARVLQTSIGLVVGKVARSGRTTLLFALDLLQRHSVHPPPYNPSNKGECHANLVSWAISRLASLVLGRDVLGAGREGYCE